MAAFRDRPLTWLFLIASACLDAVGAVAAPESNWVESMVVGQLLIVGCWPALGRTHRLASAGLWLTAMLTIAAYSWLTARVHVEWRYVLGSVMFMGASATILTYACRLGLRLATPEPPRPKFQFPIVEFFGWTIVVAVATVAFRESVMVHLEKSSYKSSLVAISGIIALWMAIFLGPTRIPRVAVAVTTAVASGLLFLMGAFPGMGFIKEATASVGVLLYVAAFITVLRMDESRAANTSTAAMTSEDDAVQTSVES